MIFQILVVATFFYSPSLHRVRRMPQPRRDDREWSEKDRQVLFSPDFMRRVWFLAPLKFLEELRSPEEFYLRPLLYREKFPQDRRIEIPADLEERIRSQEAVGHLVFESRVQAKSQ